MTNFRVRFRLSGGSCKRTEVQRRQAESAPGVSADRAQISLKIKKPLRGEYFWCLHTVSNTQGEQRVHTGLCPCCVVEAAANLFPKGGKASKWTDSGLKVVTWHNACTLLVQRVL